MESNAEVDSSGNHLKAEKKINWQLDQALLSITRGTTDHTFDFYFSDQEVLAKVTFQKEGRFYAYDSQLDARSPRDLKAQIIGRINWTDESTAKHLISAIIAWEQQRCVDSDSLKDHWINYHQLILQPDMLYGGLRFYINCFEIERAVNSMNEEYRAERLRKIQSKITFF